MDAPLISVVIPVHNAAAFLAETLASVFAQAYEPLEVVLVDDGSTAAPIDRLSDRRAAPRSGFEAKR